MPDDLIDKLDRCIVLAKEIERDAGRMVFRQRLVGVCLGLLVVVVTFVATKLF